MATIHHKTKGDSSPSGKPRVFFICHPEDFDKYFHKVCADLFQTQDCAVYFTPDMAEPMTEDDRIINLDRSQLLVIPITRKLLLTENRAMDEDIPFAIRRKIRILPLMMEGSLNKIYSREDKFGHLQYLTPFSEDATEIPYAEKLKNYLNNVLVSDEMAQKIRGAFSAYMFLSYRKQDRKLAKTLMEIIHHNEKFWDIAIWFDEFLTPGKKFDKEIDENLEKSKFFTLLVTPHLIDAGNYAMTTEYRKACLQNGLLRLPVEMEKTNLEALANAHPELPKITDCADPTDEATFNQRLLALWEQAELTCSAQTPWKEYLIGTAYAEGIDMETDRARGVAMIRSAAEQALPEAMDDLFHRYVSGAGVPLDWKEAEIWAERYCNACTQKFGESAEETTDALHALGSIQLNLCKYRDAQKTFQQLYDTCCELYDADSQQVLGALNCLAEAHRLQGHYKQALACIAQINNALSDTEHSLLYIATLNSQAMIFQSMGMYSEALQQSKKVFQMACAELGTEHPHIFILRENLGLAYADAGQFDDALKTLTENRELREARLPKDHPDILVTISDLGKVYGNSGDYGMGLKLSQEAYDRRLVVLGEKHPDTLTSMNNLAMAHKRLSHYQDALDLSSRECTISSEVLGTNHPDTLISQHNLSSIYIDLARYQEARLLIKAAYETRLEVLGRNHPSTMHARYTLAHTEMELGAYSEALKLFRQSHTHYVERYGEDYPEALHHLEMIAQIYSTIGTEAAHQEAERILKDLYQRLCNNLTPNHPHIYSVVNMHVVNLVQWGKLEEARSLQKQLYEDCRKHLGIEDSVTADALCNLSRIHTHLGNAAKLHKDKATARKEHEKAVELARKAHTMSCEIHGREHPATLDKLNALAVAQGEAGDYKKAAATMSQVYDLRCKVLGEKHLDTIESLSNLSAMQGHRGKTEASLKKDLQVFEICCEILGETHPTSIRYLDNLANTYHDLGMEQETLAADNQIYELRKKSQGMEHPDTFTALCVLQANLRRHKEYARLVELAPEALKISEAVHGAESEPTLNMVFSCAGDYFKNGDRSTCLKMLEQLYPRCCDALGQHHKLTMLVFANLHSLRASS